MDFKEIRNLENDCIINLNISKNIKRENVIESSYILLLSHQRATN